jgi:hypothetical protein
MRFDSIDDIRHEGFHGFLTVSDLQESSCQATPQGPGVYLVLWPVSRPPVFLPQSIGGRFKSQDPRVATSQLRNAWVEASLVLYIGKAGGPSTAATLRSRVRQYMRFGQGKRVGHWGGRYIWQLDRSDNLLLCWKSTPGADPQAVESDLLMQFRDVYGALPFANLRH